MRRVAVLVLSGVVAGCGSLEPRAADAKAPSSAAAEDDEATRDQQVLDTVLRDIVWPDEPRKPFLYTSGRPLIVHVGGSSYLSAPSLLDRYRESDWKDLPADALPSVEAAAGDLVARGRRGDVCLTSADPRICVLPPNDHPDQGREGYGLEVLPPGYGFACGVAMVFVRVGFVLGSEDFTYVLERSPAGWEVIVRQWRGHP